MYKNLSRAGLLLAMHLILSSDVSYAFERSYRPIDTSLDQKNPILRAQKINNTTVEVIYADNKMLTLDFYGDNVFRVFQDNNGGVLRGPQATPPAQILVDNPRRVVSELSITDNVNELIISTAKTKLVFDKHTGLFKGVNKISGKVSFALTAPIKFEKNRTIVSLEEDPDAYYFGGGVQNGRFSHKGKIIAIENQNSWTDGGVASPTPFYWSTSGYGMMWYTFKKGKYDFGSTEKGIVTIQHETNYLDIFLMINDGAVPLLNDFYQLTGNPILLPKFGFYQGHLNAYNRDYWKEDEKGILFEDGKRYKETQQNNGGIKESLNGEKNNYQFSARAVIDRYKNHDMPLGWILPNDGYGAGYGQTETLLGNIQNLKEFGDYARKNGVEIGLWTQSDLHPKDGVSPLLQRDIVKEVRDAGVRVLKTDVAWVGPGYSFGLNGIADVGHIMPYYGNEARPFIISLDGWAGSQRYAGIWSGDQTGGVWEYIRFHIPTYLGSGLSGQPNITSDMDGIFGGKNLPVLVRDYQWKTFTPMELNMDGWGANEKYPHALGEPSSSINRNYLKLKSELIPYAYSIAKEAVDGLPMVRAMFLEYPNTYTLGKSTQYQFLYGPNFLVAPIYQAIKADDQGNDIRNGIYLPEGQWIDYFSGELYTGGRIINNFKAPIWKLPVFVKQGAIIPMTNPNNNVFEIAKNKRIIAFYPFGKSTFKLYDDDGTTVAYKLGKGATTLITSDVVHNKAVLTVEPTIGTFEGMVDLVETTFVVNTTARPKKINALIGKQKQTLKEVFSLAELEAQENVFFYEVKPNLNRFATKDSPFAKVEIIKNPQVYIKLKAASIKTNLIKVELDGFEYNPIDRLKLQHGPLNAPKNAGIKEAHLEAYKVKPTWESVLNADYYDIEFDGQLYSTIQDTTLLFEDLTAETNYSFKIRAVNADGASDWTTFSTFTKSNPLEFALSGVVAKTSVSNQGGAGADKLFDFDESTTWHTKYGAKAVPFDLIVDLKTFNQLDKFHYLPRTDIGNGTILKGTVSISENGEEWTSLGAFDWKRDAVDKVFKFDDAPTARYIKLSVVEAVGNYGSGRELYIFKVPGTESYIPGDINNDRLLDANDLISYTNYTGLRKGDADFDGYISNGDINKNGLIDAYDISTLTTQLGGGIDHDDKTKQDTVAGTLSFIVPKTNFQKDEIIEILVKGNMLNAVNGLSFALPYSAQDYEYIGVESLHMAQMENLSKDRLHSNGNKALYPTFVNIGDQTTLNGDVNLFIIKLKAKRDLRFDLKAIDGLLIDKQLNVAKF